jgi:glutathione S-transferase
MTRTLYNASRSPYGRKVRIVLAEKNLDYNLQDVDLANRSSEFLQLSPIGKIPVFVDQDGTSLWDSTLIVEYLEVIYPLPSFYPAKLSARTQCRQWEELADAIADYAVRLMLDQRKGEQGCKVDQAKFQTVIDRLLARLDQKLAGQTYLMGELESASWTIVDVTAVASLGYYSLRFGEQWRSQFVRLANWYEKMHERDSVKSTIPPA